jgi:multicomponent Na+:H+ antiporter subunit E
MLMPKTSHLRQVLPLALALFVLWLVLSGKFDAFHVSIGAVSALWVALGTRRLLLLPPDIGPPGTHPAYALPLRFLGYVPWLVWEIVVSSLHVAYVVLHPGMPIQPRLLRFDTSFPHVLAQLTLAASITLAPGTVTLDVDNGEFLVHALTDTSARGLEPNGGAMYRRVAALFRSSRTGQDTSSTG